MGSQSDSISDMINNISTQKKLRTGRVSYYTKKHEVDLLNLQKIKSVILSIQRLQQAITQLMIYLVFR